MKRVLLTGLVCLGLAACGTVDKIASIGEAPEMTPIENPVTKAEYQPVSLPMPAPKDPNRQQNSLWSANRTTFFQDQRAADVGDIITVLVDIEDEAQLENESERTRTSDEDAQLPSLLGYETALNRILPQDVDNTDLTDFDSSSLHRGTGTVEREEEVTVRMAALVTQILPNGNMVISGKQEVLVNFEKRILMIDGVIRPEDITTSNTVSSDQIAEARIVYGGEGDIMDVQQPRYGQQLYDIVFPF